MLSSPAEALQRALWRHVGWLLIAVLAAPVVIVAIATARLFVWPSTAAPAQGDAVVVLSGDYGERIARGLQLIRAGAARTLVLDGQPDSEAIKEMCRSPQPFEVVCLAPRPDNTRTEARAAASLSTRRGWRRLIVVTSTAHLTRTQLLVDRCYDGDLQVVGARPPYGLRTKIGAIAHEWLGLGHALFLDRRC